jgi:DNA-binding transcriptional ArsR family regulator
MSNPFEGVLGNSSELRMLEYLLPLEGIDFNITELAEGIGVSRVTVTRIVKKFVELGVLNSKKTSRITYYSINLDSPIVKNIDQLNNILIENILGDEALYEIHDYWETQRPRATSVRNAAGDAHIHQMQFYRSLTSVATIGLEGLEESQWQRGGETSQIPYCPSDTNAMHGFTKEPLRELPIFGGEI